MTKLRIIATGLCIIVAAACCNKSRIDHSGHPALPDTIELGENGSGIATRIYVHGGVAGTAVVAIRLSYTDGDRAVLHLRQDGTLSDCQEYFGSSKDVKSSAVFATDGTTLLSGELYASPSELCLKVERVNDKEIRIDRYSAGGQPQYISQSEQTDAAGNARITYYSRGGTRAVATIDTIATPGGAYGRRRAAKLVQLRANGLPSCSVDYTQGNAEYVTWYAADGKTPTHTQQWWQWYCQISPGMNGELQRIEEFESDGTTIKRIIYCSEKPKYHHFVRSVDVYVNGKLASSRYYDNDGKEQKTAIEKLVHVQQKPVRYLVAHPLVKEEVYDGSGKTTGSTAYNAGQAIYDPFDTRLFLTPYNDEADDKGGFVSCVPSPGAQSNDPARNWYRKIVAP